ncbi:MAG: lysophospholipid acyltransferase family protein [Bacteroidota bacterium]
MQKFSFHVFYVIVWLLGWLPWYLLYLFADGIYLLVFYVIGYRKKVVLQNLSNAFPEKDDDEILTIRKKFYRHFCDLIVEIIKTIHLSAEDLEKRVSFQNTEVFQELRKKGKHAICVIGHYGNWEWIATFEHYLPGFKNMTIYKTLTNRWFDKFMYDQRAKLGVEPVPMGQILRKIIAYDQQGELTATGFISDQCPPQKDIQYWTQFLNQDTPMYMGIEKIAGKFNMGVVFLYVEKPSRGHYVYHVKLLADEVGHMEPTQITEMHTKALEDMIRKRPELWLWTHRRWKRKRQ